jgi:hypothetical protein
MLCYPKIIDKTIDLPTLVPELEPDDGVPFHSQFVVLAEYINSAYV